MRLSVAVPNPLVYPIIHRLVPELAVLRLEYPVALIREVEHFRRNLQPLQSGKELKAFRNIEPVIELAMYYKSGCLEARREEMW